jgi:hypothetical protein
MPPEDTLSLDPTDVSFGQLGGQFFQRFEMAASAPQGFLSQCPGFEVGLQLVYATFDGPDVALLAGYQLTDQIVEGQVVRVGEIEGKVAEFHGSIVIEHELADARGELLLIFDNPV